MSSAHIKVTLYDKRKYLGRLEVEVGRRVSDSYEVCGQTAAGLDIAPPRVGTYRFVKSAPVRKDAVDARAAFGDRILLFRPTDGDRSYALALHGGSGTEGELSPTEGGLRMRDEDFALICKGIDAAPGIAITLEIVEEKLGFFQRFGKKKARGIAPVVIRAQGPRTYASAAPQTSQQQGSGMDVMDWYLLWYLLDSQPSHYADRSTSDAPTTRWDPPVVDRDPVGGGSVDDGPVGVTPTFDADTQPGGGSVSDGPTVDASPSDQGGGSIGDDDPTSDPPLIVDPFATSSPAEDPSPVAASDGGSIADDQPSGGGGTVNDDPPDTGGSDASTGDSGSGTAY